MSAGDPFLLLKYTFRNIGAELVRNLFFGQLMKFSIGDFRNNLGAWEANNGLGFAYMYENENSATPYVGMVMFDASGQSVNSSLTLNIDTDIRSHNEALFASAMRSDSIETATPAPGSYAMLPAIGPFSLVANDSIAPFWLAIVVGDNLEDLRNAVQQAVLRSAVITYVDVRQSHTPEKFVLFQNYPNPFNPSTTIEFALPRKAEVTLQIFDLLGRVVITLVEDQLGAGSYKLTFEAEELPSGIYFYRFQALDFIKTRKFTLMK